MKKSTNYAEVKEIYLNKRMTYSHLLHRELKMKASLNGTLLDEPMYRQGMNDYVDGLIKDLNNTEVLREVITESEGWEIENELTNY
jgi:hypothetical protein